MPVRILTELLFLDYIIDSSEEKELNSDNKFIILSPISAPHKGKYSTWAPSQITLF